ncbi:unnamed protein product [Phytomonas sp. EM1]|nr:unnamed protein product [Phytomonas sp. EM1]|eukprot:CCW60176.1 unnamed protein product [Phytomonas sp. isolate EM1]
MKFGKRLQDEIIPEWADHYVSYKRLKRLIRNSELTGNLFRKELLNVISAELGKAEELFQELIDELQKGYEILTDIHPERPVSKSTPFRRFYPKRQHKRYDTAVSEESIVLTSRSSMYDIESQLEDHRDEGFFSFFKVFFLSAIGDLKVKPVEKNTPRAQFLEWYANAHQLQHFAELNLEAIRKASKKVKKYRYMDSDYASAIEAELSRSRLTTLMPRLHKLISDTCLDYEKKFHEPLAPYAPLNLSGEWGARWGAVFVALLLFSLILHAPFLRHDLSAHNCVALAVLIGVLWWTEAVPTFCTVLLIPLVAIPLGVVLDPGTGAPVEPRLASARLLTALFDRAQVLLLGALVLGTAVTKANLPRHGTGALHRVTAHRPGVYLLGLMAAAAAVCGVVSNAAAPFLVLEGVRCALWEFAEGGAAPHAVLLGLAFACNLGGMLSPVGSPASAIAAAGMPFGGVSFAAWGWVALPLVALGVVVAWGLLMVVWRPFREVPFIPLQVVNTEAEKEVSVATRTVVAVVSGITIILWLLPENLVFADTGLVALIPVVIFFGTGILSKKDFHNLPWHLMFLMAGGNMLRMCAHDSKLLDIVAVGLNNSLSAATPYGKLVVLALMMGVTSTFISHTVAAIVLLPIISRIGLLLEPNKGPFSVTSNSMVLLCTLMCSGAMAFPISSFPNMSSLLAEDPKGNPYLRAKNFLSCGLLIQLIIFVSVVTWMVPLTNITLEWQWS